MEASMKFLSKPILGLFVMLFATAALAAPTPPDLTAEQRKQMAEMHTKVAACLNSNKSMQECRDEMMANCPGGAGMHGGGMYKGKMPGAGMWGCPMMGAGSMPETKSDSKTKTTK